MHWLPLLKHLPLLLLGCLPLLARAAPESSVYRFERLQVDSPDGSLHYRLDLAIPRKAPPAAGYPAMYLLDGNNALAELKEDWLKELDGGNPPLLVMIGYEMDGLYDMQQRTRDYTGASSAAFLDLIQTGIKPLVQSRFPVDQSRQSLWGHSFGGLFVLYALLEQPLAFNNWFAASASLWYQPPTYDKAMAFAGIKDQPVRQVLIMRGSKEGKLPIKSFDWGSMERRKAMEAVPIEANREVARHLSEVPGIQARYRAFEGLNHSEVFAAALHPSLRLAAGLAADH
ncbi:alpha/beta hydrolase [Pseudomonas sp. Pseusp122]|uniref:alpha/beta hydrolase n=1 Tax=unclassified Pseudomonas TaxID=196821 RepID=UPI0039A5E01F